jgi:uncharacterized phage-associated protein
MKTLLEFDYKKATQAINYLAQKEGGMIDKLKLIKLIYLADRYHLRRYGRPIINDTYLAMPLGPVGSSVKDIAEFSAFLAEEEKDYAGKYIAVKKQDNIVVSVNDIDTDVFSKTDIEALDFVHKEFGELKPSKLVDITHEYPEWEKFKNVLESKTTTREPMTYVDFFENPKNLKTDKFAVSEDVLEASKDIFEDNYMVAEYWK